MITFLDKTFCPIDYCKNFADCPRALTKETIEMAAEIGLPIAQYSEPPECFVSPGEYDYEEED